MRQSLLDVVEIVLEDLTVYVDVYNNSLSRKWLSALNNVIAHDYILKRTTAGWGLPKVIEQVS